MKVGKLGSFLAVAALSAASFAYASGPAPVQKTLEEKVRHELNMLPYYGVFDDISFRVDGDKVTLLGQVWQPVLKLNTESAIKSIEGVKQVDDQIEVLPLSNFDDQIRFQTLRAIYGYPALSRYVLNTHPSIHIIVKNGNVTLTGVVANKMDSEMAYMRANGIHGAFSVKNELRVENS
jgi:hyperosmotically inducible periplasmic protein